MEYKAVFLCTMLAMPAWAQPADNQARAQELVAIFSSFCLDTYPDDSAMDAFATKHGATKLPPDRLDGYLQESWRTGRGWTMTSGNFTYTLLATRAAEPGLGRRVGNQFVQSVVRVCQVITEVQVGFSAEASFANLKKKYAEKNGMMLDEPFPLLEGVVMQSASREDSGRYFSRHFFNSIKSRAEHDANSRVEASLMVSDS